MQWLNFLFGKKPDIFNQEGEVEHQLNPDSWKEWNSRFEKGREYDWTRHSGLKGYIKPHLAQEPPLKIDSTVDRKQRSS